MMISPFHTLRGDTMFSGSRDSDNCDVDDDVNVKIHRITKQRDVKKET